MASKAARPPLSSRAGLLPRKIMYASFARTVSETPLQKTLGKNLFSECRVRSTQLGTTATGSEVAIIIVHETLTKLSATSFKPWIAVLWNCFVCTLHMNSGSQPSMLHIAAFFSPCETHSIARSSLAVLHGECGCHLPSVKT